MAGEDAGAPPSVEDVQAYIANFDGGSAPAPADDGGAPPTPDPVAPVVPDAPAAPATPDAPADPDFGPDPDLSDLDPAARAYAEQRVQDLRRKMTEVTQEAAELRRVAETVGGVENLQSLIGEIQAIQQDPQGDVARNLYNSLRGQFEAAGSSPQQAAAQAAQQVDDLAGGDLSEYDLPPEVMARLDKLDAMDSRLASFEATANAEAEARERSRIEAANLADLERQWGDLNKTYPDLANDPQALNRIMGFAASTDGNLAQAYDQYRGIWNDAQAALYKGAANVPGGIVTPTAGVGHSEAPKEYATIEDVGPDAIAMIEAMVAAGQ